MDSYEVVKTDQGHVMYVDGAFYKVPDSAVRMNKDDLALIFEGCKSKPMAGVVTTSTVATIIHTGNAPKITVQPLSAKAAPDEAVSFAVTAQGDEPLSYQWKRNGLDVNGATSATLDLMGVKQSDNDALYTCVVTNAAGSATTAQARLTVQ